MTALYSSCFPTLIHLIWQSDANEISLTGCLHQDCSSWERMLRQEPGLLGKCRSKGFKIFHKSPASRGEFYRCVYYAGTWLLNWGFMATSADTKHNKIPSLISNKYNSLGTAFPCHLQTRFIPVLKSREMNSWQKLIKGLNINLPVWTCSLKPARTGGSGLLGLGCTRWSLTNPSWELWTHLSWNDLGNLTTMCYTDQKSNYRCWGEKT